VIVAGFYLRIADNLGELPLREIARRGNGFAIGEYTGRDVTRWTEIVHLKLVAVQR